jgi:hypothetical protein
MSRTAFIRLAAGWAIVVTLVLIAALLARGLG